MPEYKHPYTAGISELIEGVLGENHEWGELLEAVIMEATKSGSFDFAGWFAKRTGRLRSG